LHPDHPTIRKWLLVQENTTEYPVLRGLVEDTAGFFATSWRRLPVVLRPRTPWAPTFGIEELTHALNGGLLRQPYLEMVDSGRFLTGAAYTSPRTVAKFVTHGYADPAKVREQVRGGATLLLRNIEHWHAPTRDLTHRLGAELGRRTEAFFFLTPPNHQGLPPHRDDADVFVIQLQGSKEWVVHAPPTDGHWESAETSHPGDVSLKTVLQAGEVLYVPRGAAHHARAADKNHSAHLSLTIHEIGTADLVTAARQALAAALDLPQRPVDESELLAVARRLLEHQRAHLHALTPEQLIVSARTAMLAAAVRPPLPLDFTAVPRSSPQDLVERSQ